MTERTMVIQFGTQRKLVIDNGIITPDVLEEFYRLCFTLPSCPENEVVALMLAMKVPGLGNARPKNHNYVPTALSVAIGMGMNFGVIEKLIENGADPTIVGGHFGTPLTVACEMGRADIAKYIAEKYPACLFIKNGKGQTPLESAKEFNRQEVIDVLSKFYYLF
jgi:ankyrin repeat protein